VVLIIQLSVTIIYRQLSPGQIQNRLNVMLNTAYVKKFELSFLG